MQLVIFDDIQSSAFYPLTLNRPISDLRCGILKLRQRLESCFAPEGTTAIVVEPILAAMLCKRHPDWLVNDLSAGTKLYVNARIKISEEAIKQVNQLRDGDILIAGDTIVAAKSELCLDNLDPLQARQCDLALYESLSDIIHDNSRMLDWDFKHYFYDNENYFETEPGVTVLHPYNVWIAEGVILGPGVVLDASEGPIVLDSGVKVMPNAVLCGPLYIGKNSLVKIGAKIYGGTSIGPVCKIGGEIEGSIFQAYSNKQHDGFLGHSYIGEWVNLGADTNNSDLKNTYKNVAYYSYKLEGKIDSGTQFLGCVIGDHSKTGINCSINTGTVIGMGCNLWGSKLISDFIPDFSWGEAGELSPYRFAAFCQTATIVKARRKLSLDSLEIDIYKHRYKHGE
ncbi:MAG: putative sugar nucleotidyl transferase [Candidatus Cloacimonas sp.]|jgi:UDP-N-acetylglucosamine diphosphorylase/glucosamine-1-phosphate N-acetyltransferase|nr:putative sugar nucleotidyl transferase [Candidatus Cloacimonas sp.]